MISLPIRINLLDEIAQVLVIDSPDVADPAVRVGLLALLAEREGEGAVDIGEDDFFVIVVLVFL